MLSSPGCTQLHGMETHGGHAEGHEGTRGGTRVGVGSPEGPRDPHSVSRAAGPRLTAWYPVDDITTLVSMVTESHGCLCSRSYVTAQPDRHRTPRHSTAPHGTPAPHPIPPSPCGHTARPCDPASPQPHGANTAGLPVMEHSRTTGHPLSPGSWVQAPAAPHSPVPPLWAAPRGLTAQSRPPQHHRGPMLAPAWLPGAPHLVVPTSRTNTERPRVARGGGGTGMLSFAVPRAQPRPPPCLCRLEGVKCHSCGVPGDGCAPRSCRRPFCRRGAGAASSRQLSEDLWSVQSRAGAQQPVLGRATPYPTTPTAARPCPRHLLGTAGCQVTPMPKGPTQPRHPSTAQGHAAAEQSRAVPGFDPGAEPPPSPGITQHESAF